MRMNMIWRFQVYRENFKIVLQTNTTSTQYLCFIRLLAQERPFDNNFVPSKFWRFQILENKT